MGNSLNRLLFLPAHQPEKAQEEVYEVQVKHQGAHDGKLPDVLLVQFVFHVGQGPYLLGIPHGQPGEDRHADQGNSPVEPGALKEDVDQGSQDQAEKPDGADRPDFGAVGLGKSPVAGHDREKSGSQEKGVLDSGYLIGQKYDRERGAVKRGIHKEHDEGRGEGELLEAEGKHYHQNQLRHDKDHGVYVAEKLVMEKQIGYAAGKGQPQKHPAVDQFENVGHAFLFRFVPDVLVLFDAFLKVDHKILLFLLSSLF